MTSVLEVRRSPASARRLALGEWMGAPEWVTVIQASDLTGHDAEYLRQLIRKGKIKAEKLPGGRDWLINRPSLEAHVKQMKKLGNDKFNPYRKD